MSKKYENQTMMRAVEKFAKNERGYRFLILLLSVAYIRRKGLKRLIPYQTEERRTHTNSRSCIILLR